MRTYKKKIAKKPPASFIINKQKQEKCENSASTDKNLEQSQKVPNTEKHSSNKKTAKNLSSEKKLQKDKLKADKSETTSDKAKKSADSTSKKSSSQESPKLQKEEEILHQVISGSMGQFQEVLKKNSDKFLQEVEVISGEVEALMEQLGFETSSEVSVECLSTDEDVEDLTEEEREFVEKNFGKICEDITKFQGNKDKTKDGKMTSKVKKFMLSNLKSFKKDLQSLKSQELSDIEKVMITSESDDCTVNGKTPKSDTFSPSDLKFDSMVEKINVLADMDSFLKEKNSCLKEVPIKDAGAFVEELFSSVKDKLDSFGEKNVEVEILKSSDQESSGVVVSFKNDHQEVFQEEVKEDLLHESFCESNNQPAQKS